MKFAIPPFYSNLPVIIAAIMLIAVSVISSGCYSLKQGTIMLGYLGRAVPLKELSTGENVSEEDRLFVTRVENIRRFAMTELGLKESKNYTRYVKLNRDYLAAVVSASPKDSFGRYEWWFPVVGKLPYKGFFLVKDAGKERAKLEKKGLDVWIRGVDAFSTLGWFRDPLYSYMKKYSEQYLAELIIHELFHATLYLKNFSQFNEQLAEFVGTEGARLYMGKKQIENPTVEGALDAGETDAALREDREVYLSVIQDLIAELDRLYKSDVPREEKLLGKEEIIAVAKASFNENYDSLFKTENYKFFSELPINNAYLELFRLYHEEDFYFKGLYERTGEDLIKFIATAVTLNGINKLKCPREEFERALGLK
jgi:predicted aminopeptidase